MKRTLLITVCILLAIIGCKPSGYGSGGPDLPTYQTTILLAYAIPQTVVPGDTALFVCNISDSTDSTFKFYWSNITPGTPIGGRDTTYHGVMAFYTSENHIKWKAPSKPYTYTIEVTVDNGSKVNYEVDTSFDITVK